MSKVALVVFSLTMLGFSCQTQNGAQTKQGASRNANVTPGSSEGMKQRSDNDASASGDVPTYAYEVVNAWPHDRTAFTQGLIFSEGALLESTGQNGESSLRRVELTTGKVLKQVDVDDQYFAEGLTLFQGKLFQLTWQHKKGFIYDPATFAKQGEFRYDGEGWGLTHDGKHLILSDGTNQIRFIDPTDFSIARTISVFEDGRPLRELNELEFIRGEIYANIWHTDRIVRIDPATGKILGWIDLNGLLPDAERRDPEAVLNGIAYDEAGDRLFVTGKLWPKLFEIRPKKKA